MSYSLDIGPWVPIQAALCAAWVGNQQLQRPGTVNRSQIADNDHVTRSHALSTLIVVAALVSSTSAPAQQIAITWDDLPAHSALPQGETRVEIGHKLIAAMKDAHLPPVYGFVNGVQLEHEPASAPMLKDWRDAGFPLGNHTWSHMNLNTMSLVDWEADLVKNEPILAKYAGGDDWHWLRYPFLAEGDTPEKRAEARKFLADHGYRIAAVTMSFGDYMWNEPYARCIAKNDTAAIAQLESTYLQAAADDADFRRAMSKTLLRPRHPIRPAHARRRIRCPHASPPA